MKAGRQAAFSGRITLGPVNLPLRRLQAYRRPKYALRPTTGFLPSSASTNPRSLFSVQTPARVRSMQSGSQILQSLCKHAVNGQLLLKGFRATWCMTGAVAFLFAGGRPAHEQWRQGRLPLLRGRLQKGQVTSACIFGRKLNLSSHSPS